MLTRILAMLAALSVGALLSVHAQRHAPWPSEYFDPPKRIDVAGQFDYYMLVLSWSPTHCAESEAESHSVRNDMQCAGRKGRRYGFILHGLWPQYEKGYPERCPTAWRPFVPEPVIASVTDVMPSRGLVIHEYRVHGTCSGLLPAPYFALARRFLNRIRIPKRYQNPFERQFVSPRELRADFVHANPGLKPDMIAITCGGPGERLREVRICMTKDIRPRPCGDASARRLCRARQMHVPPVRSTWRGDGDASSSSSEGKPPLPGPRIIESPRRF
jgi:ribonuclease T2